MEHDLGFVTNADGGFVLSDHPATVVAPDVGYFRSDRYPGGMPERGFYPLPPDLAVEVFSPTERKADIAEQQALYAKAGVPLVCWVDPERKIVTIYRLGADAEVIEATGTLDGGRVLPGFVLELRTICRDE